MKKLMRSISLALMTSLMLSTMSSSILADEHNEDPIIMNGGSEEDDIYYNSAENQALVTESFNRLVNNNNQTRAVSTKILNVIGTYQRKLYYCGPASVYITLRYVNGTSPSQDTLAASMDTSEETGTNVSAVATELNNRIGAGTYAVYHTSDGAMNIQIENSINYEYPVIYNPYGPSLINYEGTPAGGHYVVGTGYKLGWSGSQSYDDIHYFDPYDPSKLPDAVYDENPYGDHVIPYSDLLAAINENTSYYIAKS